MIELAASGTTAHILPDEGGVAVRLRVEGRDVLCRTAGADAPEQRRSVAATEEGWVDAWRGGWQLCFPSAGQPDAGARPPQGFHGSASQAVWAVLERADRHVVLTWDDGAGLSATRTWSVAAGALAATTTARNAGSGARRLAIAEHLILGGDVLAHPLRLTVPEGTALSTLDYDGAPAGDPVPWPGEDAAAWPLVAPTTPARVAAVSPPSTAARRIGLDGPHVRASITWSGDAVPHALLWEELGASTGPPWNGAVFALGIEPTSTPHGLGTGFDDRVVELAAGEEITWTCSLRLAWTPDGEEIR